MDSSTQAVSAGMHAVCLYPQGSMLPLQLSPCKRCIGPNLEGQRCQHGAGADHRPSMWQHECSSPRSQLAGLALSSMGSAPPLTSESPMCQQDRGGCQQEGRGALDHSHAQSKPDISGLPKPWCWACTYSTSWRVRALTRQATARASRTWEDPNRRPKGLLEECNSCTSGSGWLPTTCSSSQPPICWTPPHTTL